MNMHCVGAPGGKRECTGHEGVEMDRSCDKSRSYNESGGLAGGWKRRMYSYAMYKCEHGRKTRSEPCEQCERLLRVIRGST